MDANLALRWRQEKRDGDLTEKVADDELRTVEKARAMASVSQCWKASVRSMVRGSSAQPVSSSRR